VRHVGHLARTMTGVSTSIGWTNSWCSPWKNRILQYSLLAGKRTPLFSHCSLGKNYWIEGGHRRHRYVATFFRLCNTNGFILWGINKVSCLRSNIAQHFAETCCDDNNQTYTYRCLFVGLVAAPSLSIGRRLVAKHRIFVIQHIKTCFNFCFCYLLGSVQGGPNNCVRQGAKESGQICISYEEFDLGNFGVA
jgi:hypothetical protein